MRKRYHEDQELQGYLKEVYAAQAGKAQAVLDEHAKLSRHEINTLPTSELARKLDGYLDFFVKRKMYEDERWRQVHLPIALLDCLARNRAMWLKERG